MFYEKLTVKEFDPTQSGDLEGTKGAYRLAFLEFNDKGQMFAPPQLERVLAEIRTARTASAPPVIALFVHGWKNNASDQSGNVWGFRQVLAGLAFQYADRPVLGIYVGWRGATINAPILKEFTVFDRHHASQRIARPVIADAMQQIVAAAKQRAGDADPAPATIVLIGHSFGGAVLENALTPALASAITDARAGHRNRVTWPADLVVLLNEAQEAQSSYPLIEMMQREMKDRNPCAAPGAEEAANQRPAVVSISSTGDVATRAFFPGEQLLARPFQDKTYHGTDPYHIGRTRLYYATTAHIGTLRSHVFGRDDDPDVKAASAACGPSLDLTLAMGAQDLHYLIVARKDAPNRTPYWVMHMPTTVVPDHSTIFTQVFRDFLITLIAQAMLLPPQDELRDQPLAVPGK